MNIFSYFSILNLPSYVSHIDPYITYTECECVKNGKSFKTTEQLKTACGNIVSILYIETQEDLSL